MLYTCIYKYIYVYTRTNTYPHQVLTASPSPFTAPELAAAAVQSSV